MEELVQIFAMNSIATNIKNVIILLDVST